VLFSLIFDAGRIDQSELIPGFFSIGLGVIILIHSAFINKNKMHSVRFSSDFAAVNMILYAVFLLIAYYRPNKTKGVICFNVFCTGIYLSSIQLCDAYLFYNRLLAVTNVPKWKKYFTFFYLSVLVFGPYYSVFLWLPLFYDFNSDGYKLSSSLRVLNTVGYIAYEIYFLFEFIYVLYKIYGEENYSSGSPNQAILIIIIKSLAHFVTSIASNLISIYSVFLFSNPEIIEGVVKGVFLYNMAICFGIHFFFNFKCEIIIYGAIDAYSTVQKKLDSTPNSSKIFRKPKVSSYKFSRKISKILPDMDSRDCNVIISPRRNNKKYKQ
jgi:hypothetical protein